MCTTILNIHNDINVIRNVPQKMSPLVFPYHTYITSIIDYVSINNAKCDKNNSNNDSNKKWIIN